MQFRREGGIPSIVLRRWRNKMDGHAFEEYWSDIQEEVIRQFEAGLVDISSHAGDQMTLRHLNETDIRYIILNNLPDEMYKAKEYPHGPTPFQNKDPVFSITGRDRLGNWIVVALAIRSTKHHRLRFTIVTVIDQVSPKSRHRIQK
ncbi:hypothetical protein LLE49_25155 [Alicyclobacillus tolerans]|uniref:hypothetical protein n=1 Tax=Alicyclobacillus tolerans TaxID=90970 RepID=UPI001F33DB65|nr:hypothetical protein [Alicyclobacillus tolerans]MCF8568017.1 hypothetical protein [Alicyclobacillus tolerans]